MAEQELSGKICVVTGAGRGIGKSIAISLAKIGGHIICISKSEDSCGTLAQDIRNQGYSAEHMAVDVSSTDLVSDACKSILGKHSAIDILINNAGITRDNLMLKMSQQEWQEVLNTNLSSCFYWTKNLLHPMMKKRWGRIINMASIVGLIGNFGQANYAAAKAGIIGFTKSIAKEVASRGITANAVAPGFIRTDMTSKLGENMVAELLKNIPMKELGTPDDVAEAVKFLCSRGARYITGHVINVDGGMVM
ncbi:MAG: 3-oxoacyl-[acyl-carrier-protein] reductase [Puniceicoccales bacterium]|jgi:3-oxoacyl-[acyl-carrier protein] reductase|nr:3-oxoacyl-[acyl-carrier-protein] reductase [Puniceicoccales bacterium]